MNEFKQEIWKLARMKFGELSEEVEQRLTVEIDAIQEHGRGEMLRTMWHLVGKLEEHNINISLTLGQGYNVSLVCYLLGISTFNPMDHTDIRTESYVISTFKSSPEIVFKIDRDRPEVIDEFLRSLKYEVEREDVPEAYLHSRKIKASIEGNSDFMLEFKFVANIGRVRIIGELIGWDRFEKIPTDDPETMKLIHDIDLYGTTTSCLAPITIEAIRKIRPSDVDELADALSFSSEKKYNHLLMYLANRNTGKNVFTGHPTIDAIVYPTHGIVLNMWQLGQILKLPLRRELGETGYNSIREKYRSLMASPIVNRCDVYVKAYDLYRLAYVKVHFPKEFKETLRACKNILFKPFDETRLNSDKTGLPYITRVYTNRSELTPIVEFEESGTDNYIIVSVERFPIIVDGVGMDLKYSDIEKIQDWIRLNHDALMDYWSEKFDSADLISNLKKL